MVARAAVRDDPVRGLDFLFQISSVQLENQKSVPKYPDQRTY